MYDCVLRIGVMSQLLPKLPGKSLYGHTCKISCMPNVFSHIWTKSQGGLLPLRMVCLSLLVWQGTCTLHFVYRELTVYVKTMVVVHVQHWLSLP